MKRKLTPIPYPATQEEEYKWGFDVYRPEGTPMAWIMDWTSAGPGWGVSLQEAIEVCQFKAELDLSQLSVDDLVAALSVRHKMAWHGFVKALQDRLGPEETIAIIRQMGFPAGERNWKGIQEQLGTQPPVDKIALYEDFTHLLSGPCAHPYAWCDGRKTVVTRTECNLKPPPGMEECAKYCRVCDDAAIEGGMNVVPGLLIVRVPDLGDMAEEPRCVHLFTYEKEVIERLSDDLKVRIPDSTREVLKGKGVCL